MAFDPVTPAFVRGLAIAGGCLIASAGTGTGAGQRATLDTVLAAYLDGDSTVVARVFSTSLDFQAFRLGQVRPLDRWLGSWHRGKAALVIELATQSSVAAPQYTTRLLGAGRRYLATRTQNPSDEAFARLWHRVALGLLQRMSTPSTIEDYLDGLPVPQDSGASDDPIDARFLLARAIAQERRCRDARPVLERTGIDVLNLARASGAAIRAPDRPAARALAIDAVKWRACLAEATARFEVAARAPETAAEARVRGGWLLFQQGDPQQALVWLQTVDPAGDRDLAYWAALFSGRVLDALDRHEAAVDAYRAALAVCPAAQSAGIGLALALVRADRVAEADEFARSLRTGTANVLDPWWIYGEADSRFVDGWIGELRAAAR